VSDEKDIQLERDAEGNVIVKPVTGVVTGTLAEISVLLVIEYLASPEQTGKTQSIQFGLTPQQALYLAEALTRKANAVLIPPPSGVH
jgi:hypothetical protein